MNNLIFIDLAWQGQVKFGEILDGNKRGFLSSQVNIWLIIGFNIGAQYWFQEELTALLTNKEQHRIELLPRILSY